MGELAGVPRRSRNSQPAGLAIRHVLLLSPQARGSPPPGTLSWTRRSRVQAKCVPARARLQSHARQRLHHDQQKSSPYDRPTHRNNRERVLSPQLHLRRRVRTWSSACPSYEMTLLSRRSWRTPAASRHREKMPGCANACVQQHALFGKVGRQADDAGRVDRPVRSPWTKPGRRWLAARNGGSSTHLVDSDGGCRIARRL